MCFDIIFVTFNSEKWIDNCINSILSSDYNLKNVNLLFYDNNSTDSTIKILQECKQKYEYKLGNFIIIQSKKNRGFGVGNNKAAKFAKSDFLFFLNIDTEIFPDTLKKLENEILNTQEDFAAWELKQVPYEHPKYYDPHTNEVSWASGACIVVKKNVFKEVHGFSRMIFMYAEDVEISWHIRKKGYKIKYLPNIPINHYSYSKAYEFKPTQYIFSTINNLFLRYRYGKFLDMVKGNYYIAKIVLKNHGIASIEEENKIRKKIFVEWIKMQFKALILLPMNVFSKTKGDFKPIFKHFEYEEHKLDPYYEITKLKQYDYLVSIIVRTCGRPDVLRETLCSIRNQYYKNIEVVIVEDGPPISKQMIETEFSDMNVLYHSFGENKGRSKAGNYGMRIANGKYLNFLDDDDLFFPDHVSILVNELVNSNYKVAYSTAFETPIRVFSKSPYVYEITDRKVEYKGEFNRMRLMSSNITPIQCVMFEKEVFEKCGGFDEKIESLEDWDLWIRFALKYDWKYVPRTTSLYRVPYDRFQFLQRSQFIDSNLNYIKEKYKDTEVHLTVKDLWYLAKDIKE